MRRILLYELGSEVFLDEVEGGEYNLVVGGENEVVLLVEEEMGWFLGEKEHYMDLTKYQQYIKADGNYC